MENAHEFLKNLALVLGVAAATTIVFQRLKQPVVFGYMLAGLVIGPHVPIPLVVDQGMVLTLSELGVILLMFSLGLEFSLRRLIRAGPAVVIVAVLQSSTMLWVGYWAGRMLGWGVGESIFAGAAIAISSTTIIVKAFADEQVRGRVADLVFGILIVEDLIAIVLLAILTPAAGGVIAAGPLAPTILRLAGFLALFLVVGMLVVPRLVRYVVRLQRHETTLVACVGVCFGAAFLAHWIGYSVALGAFLAGSLVSESGESQLIERLIEPVRDMFAAIFFVSVGMLIDPSLVARHWLAVLVFTVLVVLGKIAAVSISAFLTGAGTRTALQAGMSLGQIGEFSFIIAGAGVATGVINPALYPITVSVSAITTLLTPWLIRAAGPTAAAIDRKLPRPLQTFVTLYGSWIESLRSRPESSAEKARLRRIARGLVVDAAVVVGLCIAASIMAAPLGSRVAVGFHLSAFAGQAIVVGTAVLLTIPFLIAMGRTSWALGQALSLRAFPGPEPNKLDLAAAPRRAMVITLQLTTILVIGAPLVAVTQPFVPAPIGVVVLAVFLAVLGALAWRTAADLHGHVRAAAEVIVSAIGRQSRPGDEAEHALERAYRVLPGLGEPVSVRIESGYAAVGQPLSHLALRGRTGATIIAISRDEGVVLVPSGREVLRANDVVALVGSQAAIEAARAVLLGE